jgi:hypothetical protein
MMRLVTSLILITASAAQAADHPTHRCARACIGPCARGKACVCDGRTCPIRVILPDGTVETEKAEIAQLPRRKTACPDRPLSIGKTWRRDQSGYFWVCNDPECYGCQSDNEDFRARKDESRPARETPINPKTGLPVGMMPEDEKSWSMGSF